MTITGVRGDDLRLDTGSGSVRGGDIDVKTLKADVGSGGFDLTHVKADRVTADVGSGGLELDLHRAGERPRGRRRDQAV